MAVLVLLFVVLPIAELYVIVQASHAFGVGNTLGMLIVVSILGAWIVKHVGLKVWGRFMQQVTAGKVPSNEIADGFCVLLAGALLVVPGFITDTVGFLLLLPPVRALARRLLTRRFVGKAQVIKATYGGPIYDTTEHHDRHELE